MTAAHIAYHTTDEVNLQFAKRAARECGAFLTRLDSPVTRTASVFGAVMHDLDHVDTQSGRAVVHDLLSGPAPFPVAVHSYNLEDDEATALQANGVFVSREFNPALVRDLCRATATMSHSTHEIPGYGSPESLDDPAALCAMVRSLASFAHQTMRMGLVATSDVVLHEIDDLKELVSQLQRRLDRIRRDDPRAFADLQRWLDSLLRCIEVFVARLECEADG